MSMRLLLTFLFIAFGTLSSDQARGFSEGGHRVVALLAFDLLPPAERQELLRILEAHPRYDADFAVPEGVRDDESAAARWRVGATGYWPDVARSFPEWDRPTWHYQLGAALVVGDPTKSNVPATPGPLPQDATLATQELHIAQALELCRQVLNDRSRPDADRAIAICWIAHLVADAHQPCHAGSLYAETVFPEGDRGANSIPLDTGSNLHAFWDGLLGEGRAIDDVERRMQRIANDPALVVAGEHAADETEELVPERWLTESRAASRRFVYSPETLAPVEAVMRGLATEVAPVDLSEDYVRVARRLAELRAAEAAHRLAAVWSEGLRASP